MESRGCVTILAFPNVMAKTVVPTPAADSADDVAKEKSVMLACVRLGIVSQIAMKNLAVPITAEVFAVFVQALTTAITVSARPVHHNVREKSVAPTLAAELVEVVREPRIVMPASVRKLAKKRKKFVTAPIMTATASSMRMMFAKNVNMEKTKMAIVSLKFQSHRQ